MVKLAVNLMGLSNVEALGEALALTTQYGVQRSDFSEFLTNSLFSHDHPMFPVGPLLHF